MLIELIRTRIIDGDSIDTSLPTGLQVVVAFVFSSQNLLSVLCS